MLTDLNNHKKSEQYLILIGIFLLFIALTYASIALMYMQIQAAPLWLPLGCAFAVYIIFGKRVLPSLILASFIAAILTTTEVGPFSVQSLSIALVSSLGIYIQVTTGYKLLKYLRAEIYYLKDVRSTFIFSVVSVIVATLGATLGVGTAWLFSRVESTVFMSIWTRWWLGDVVGLLIFGSLILGFFKSRKLDLSIAGVFEVLSLFTLVFVFASVVFGNWLVDDLHNALPFLIIPVLLWIAFRFSPRETSLALIIVTIIAVIGTINNKGPFVGADVNISLLLLQLYLGVITIMSLVLSVSVQERKQVKKEYINISESLERRVAKRTDELATLNKELLVEVNQRKKAEADLKESQERNQALLHSLPDMIFLHNEEGKFIDYQAQDSNQLFSEPHQFMGKPIETILPVDIANDLKSIFSTVFKTGKTESYEYSLSINGKKQYFEARISLCGEDKLMSVVRDISNRKIAEEEKEKLEEQVRHVQKLKSLGVLAGGIAHDFNNLLTAIMGNTGLAMMNVPEDSRVSKNLNNIEKASLRAADLCRQLLAYSGKGKFVVEAININTLIKEMSKLLSVSISRKVNINYKFFEPLPAFDADATQIGQIVMNLITNASEAIGDREGNITVETGTIECKQEYLRNSYFDDKLEAGKYIFFSVVDDGCGMSEETMSKLFDPFFTTKFTGRGLGLAAVIGIVRSHRGTIKIESEEGKGTVFTILFPISQSIYSIPVAGQEQLLSWHGEGTILVVDDDESIRLLGKTTLEQVGLHVITANDGQQAVDTFKENADKISLVLMDMTMPHLSGDEAFKQIQAFRTDAKVILSSGYSEQEATQKFNNSGLCGFLQKPYKPSDLITKVKEFIS